MILVTIGFVVFSIVPFLAAGRDDTFIMLWAGQTFTFTKWFVNYNFEPQEIASSHLAAWIAAPTRWLTPEQALLATKLIGLLASCATLWVIWRSRVRFFGTIAPDPLAIAAVVATAACPSFRYWTLGGLETPYHALFLTLFGIALARVIEEAAILARPSIGFLALWSAILVLTRTEGFWPIGVTFFVLALNRPIAGRLRLILIGCGVPFVVLLVTIGLRWWFTGLPWPNPVYAKVAANPEALRRGVSYLADYYSSSPWGYVQLVALACSAVATGKMLVDGIRGRKGANGWTMLGIIGAIAAGQSGFVILSGGNWMEYFRFEVAVIPLLNIAVFLILARLVARLNGRAFTRWVTASVVALTVLAATQVRATSPRDCATPVPVTTLFDLHALLDHMLSGNCAHDRDMRDTAPLIAGPLADIVHSTPGPVTVASGQAGFFPYFLRRSFGPDQVIFIDLAGIAEQAIAVLPASRSNYGVSFDLVAAIEGKVNGPFASYFAERPPSVVYRLRMDERNRAGLARLGYELIWDRPGAVVFASRSAVEPQK
ncbi:hypothetical protein [Rhodoplanes roseus]|uniref:Glycosyltransferase RgtA/B/C/D-like domain-containing protein n=2 Tax=Hyphomicrobiales TaxID=356 RepID=A0A327KWT4_9BRAD|nr:hypothetical protein [Rhodoplanes roseus]RAI42617.1 hypothetical protein CH341_18625 [Rhodoplanes roseus]